MARSVNAYVNIDLPMVSKSDLIGQTLQPFPVPMKSLMIWDSASAALLGTATGDDLGIAQGSFGSGTDPVIVYATTGDVMGLSSVRYGRFIAPVPQSWAGAGYEAVLRVYAGFLDKDPEVSASLDLSAFVVDGVGDVLGTDIYASAALSFAGGNSIQAYNFPLDTSNFLAGRVIDGRIAVNFNDTGGVAACNCLVTAIQLLCDIR